MDYNWNWGVYFDQTGIGNEIYLDWFISGLGWTILLGLLSWIVAMILGTVLGVMRTTQSKLLSRIATVYVDIFRNVPLLVQYFLWIQVTDYLPEGAKQWFYQDLSPTSSSLVTAVICLGLFTAARVCEQVRTGIEALPKGQTGAALALGLNVVQLYRHVLLPQAFRIIIPPLTSEFLNVFKNSSVASLFGLMELLAQTKQAAEYTANYFEMFTLGTVFFFVLNMGLLLFFSWLERKVRVPGLIALGGK